MRKSRFQGFKTPVWTEWVGNVPNNGTSLEVRPQPFSGQLMPSFITIKFLFLTFNFKQDFRAFTAITQHSAVTTVITIL